MDDAPPPDARPRPRGRLDSWKEIASYVRRDVKTARRWERHEGLPVHRHCHGTLASVYAFASEIDAWRTERRSPTIVARAPKRGTPPLVGREAELAQLRAALAHARDGARQTLLVSGDIGTGKTALVDAFIAGLDGSVWFAEGQCVEQFGGGEPYQPIVEALTRLTAVATDRRSVEIVTRYAPSWSMALLRRRLSRGPAAGRDGLRDRPASELCAVVEALASLRPLVVVLEDLHWSDRPTIELLTRLSRRRDQVPLMIVATYRPSGFAFNQSDGWRLVQELRAHFHATEVVLRRLPAGAIVQYLQSHGSWTNIDAAADWFDGRSEGNALFLIHLFHHCVERGIARRDDCGWVLTPTSDEAVLPHTLRALVESHLAAIPADVRQMLDVASVAGDRFAAACVAHGAGVTIAVAESHLKHLAGRGTFIASDGPVEWPDGTLSDAYRFLHHFYREVVYDTVPASVRAALHLKMADRLDHVSRSSSSG